LEGRVPENIIPEPAKIKIDPSPPEQDSDIFDPVEFKDKPITFTLLLDGREEPIKVVETEFDTPIPDKSRLVVNDRNVCIADVRFGFKPEREQPYTLHFRVRNRIPYQSPEVFSFGPPGKNLQQVFSETIVDEGGIRADLEMTRGKTRLHIRYKPG
jgi:hypothetical protein